jgi:hypothetical protein
VADLVKYFEGTEAQILALTPASENWVELAFYYPSDQDYFYRVVDGEMKKYGSGESAVSGVGVTLNNKVIGGVKSLIEQNDILDIPENYEYNIHNLEAQGIVNCNGTINIM